MVLWGISKTQLDLTRPQNGPNRFGRRKNEIISVCQGDRLQQRSKPLVRNAAKPNYQALVLDMTCEVDGSRTSDYVVAEFLFNELCLRTEEILKIKGVGSYGQPIRVITRKEIIVSERFPDKIAFEKHLNGVLWNCTIRGGRKWSPLRFFQVPCEVSNHQIKESIKDLLLQYRM